ncbi:MAG: DUF2190 family protein [Magnetococcales bacterium]|nr:DUF2190 family protein [Magnetococcales bacterium]
MKSWIQSGNTITATAPTGGLVSGEGVLIGSLFGVAVKDAAENDPVEICTTGVVDLPKLTADVVAVGDLLYWDDANGQLTLTSTDNTLVGVAVQAADGTVSLVRVRLNGAFIQ